MYCFFFGGGLFTRCLFLQECAHPVQLLRAVGRPPAVHGEVVAKNSSPIRQSEHPELEAQVEAHVAGVLVTIVTECLQLVVQKEAYGPKSLLAVEQLKRPRAYRPAGAVEDERLPVLPSAQDVFHVALLLQRVPDVGALVIGIEVQRQRFIFQVMLELLLQVPPLHVDLPVGAWVEGDVVEANQLATLSST